MKNKEYTYDDFIRDVFLEEKHPLSPVEIWEKGKELGLDKKVGTTGKTPWATIGARIYVDMKEKLDNSLYELKSKNPVRFFYKNIQEDGFDFEKNIQETTLSYNFHERDLHPLLVKYVFANPGFRCYTKTIYHEKSEKKEKGFNEWLHPDLVGIYFPFEDFNPRTLCLQKSLAVNPIKIFSFEMKITLNFSNLRQNFFQAVSNSSWANEGYLVCLDLCEDEKFRNELQRLSNSFGIGVIRLNPEIIEESEIICTARCNKKLDWDTIDRLIDVSPEFSDFINNVSLSSNEQVVINKEFYDKVISDEDYIKYITDKKIQQK